MTLRVRVSGYRKGFVGLKGSGFGGQKFCARSSCRGDRLKFPNFELECEDFRAQVGM